MGRIHFHYRSNEILNIYGSRRLFKDSKGGEGNSGEIIQQLGGSGVSNIPVDKWNKYWETIAGNIPGEQVATWMKEWSNDQNFPWSEVMQDYVNVADGETPAFNITAEGGLQKNYDPYSPPGGKVGIMTKELALPFNWDEAKINQFNQNIMGITQQNQGLYPLASGIVKERELSRGGVAPSGEMRDIPFGGQLLGVGSAGIAPTSLIGDNSGIVNPLSLSEFIQKGQSG